MKALINDSIPVSRTLAAEFGDNAAKFIQQLHYWLTTNSGEVVNGVRWIYKTFESWASDLAISVGTIKRIVKQLREAGVIKVERLKSHRWYQVNFYTLDYEQLKKMIRSIGSNCSTPLDQIALILTKTSSQEIKTHKNTTPLRSSVRNEQGREDLTPQQTPERLTTQTANLTAETALREVGEAGISLNMSIQQFIFSTIAELGAAALQQIRDAIAVVAVAPDTHKKTGKPTNREGLFVQALKKGWKPRTKGDTPMNYEPEPLPASDFVRSPIPENRKEPDGFDEWYTLATKLGYVLGSCRYWDMDRYMVETIPGKGSEAGKLQTFDDLQMIYPLRKLQREYAERYGTTDL